MNLLINLLYRSAYAKMKIVATALPLGNGIQGWHIVHPIDQTAIRNRAQHGYAELAA